MKIHVTRCPKAGSGIPLKFGFAADGQPFCMSAYDPKRTNFVVLME
jgi:hypothetical protein